jgi:hypothetical protein
VSKLDDAKGRMQDDKTNLKAAQIHKTRKKEFELQVFPSRELEL